MTEMNGGQALVKSLYREGVRVIFGLPGVQTYHATDALYDEPGIQFITTRNEQATTYMADGYARAGRDVGTALVVPGPGLLNATSGLGTAYAASSPVLLVSGQINVDKLGKKIGVLHEVDDQLDVVRPLTKWNRRILKSADVPEAVHEAFLQLRTGRPRPVEIEIPPDVLAEVAEVELLEPGRPMPSAGDAASLDRAAEALAGAQRPVIWAGGGVISSGATEALLDLAELLQAPVITTPEGKGAISDHHYLSLGVPRGPTSAWTPGEPLRELFEASDLVLAVGTRFAVAAPLEGQQVVQIDIDPEEVGRNHAKTMGVVGDADRALKEIAQRLRSSGFSRPSREEEFQTMRAQRSSIIDDVQPQGGFIQAIRRAMPEDGILISGMTQVGYYSRRFYPVYQPATYITSSYFGTLGFAWPTALGAKVAQPDRAVVAVSGDGGFLFNSQELATAVQYGINAVVIVFNDNAFGNVLRDQRNRFNGRVVGSELHNPDFVKLAEAYGAVGLRATGPEELERTLRLALDMDRPVLIEVPVGPMPPSF
jgi:acetolactate synthase-1/2/3 large subunit